MAATTIAWPITRAIGGFSDGSRGGMPFSYQHGEFIDFKSDPDSLAVLPGTVLDSTATVVDFPLWIETVNSRTFLYGDTGHIYERLAGNNYSDLRTVASSAGQGMGSFNDKLWFMGQTSVTSYGPMSTSPSFTVEAAVLNNDPEFHPAKGFVNNLCIGNKNTLATIDDAGIFTSARLTFLPEERVRCLELWNNYLAIGTQFGTTTDIPRGNIYLWDGVSTTYNEVVPTSGVVNALLNDNGILHAWIGKQSDLYVYDGTPLTRVKRLPRLGGNGIAIRPGAVGMWKNEARFGTSLTGSETVPCGIYTYGRQNSNFPKVLSYDYQISVGPNVTEGGITIDIGAFKQLTSDIAIFSWRRSGSLIGIDRIANDINPNDAVYESIIYDAQRPHLRRKAVMERLTLTQPLRAGEYVNFYMKKDGETAWTLLGVANAANNLGQTGITFNCQTEVLAGAQYDPKGLQHEKRLTWGGTGSTRPTVSSSTLIFEEDPDVSTISN